MGALFAAASSMRITNTGTAANMAMPFVAAAWVFPTAVSTASWFWCLSDTGSSNNYFALGNNGSGMFQIGAAASSTVSSTNTATAGTNNLWHFVMGRFISATNRRISVLHPTGLVEHAQGTTSRSPAGLDQMALGGLIHSGATSFFSGTLAEFWYTSGDIQADTGVVPDWLVRQLAYGGPFSDARAKRVLIEYRSLRKHPLFGEARDIYRGGFAGSQNWTNTNAVTTGRHCPLPYWRENPQQTKKPMIF